MRHRPTELTRHHALARRFFTRDLLSGREVPGYTAADLFKFYGMLAGLFFALAYTYTRYWELFNDIETREPGYQLFVLLFSGLPLLLVLPALLGFMWWAGGALVEYSRWQRGSFSSWAAVWTSLAGSLGNMARWLEATALIRGLDKTSSLLTSLAKFVSRKFGESGQRIAVKLAVVLTGLGAGLALALVFLVPYLPFMLIRWLIVGPFAFLAGFAEYQARQSPWRWCWFIVLNFYCWTLLDLLDKIHPAMGRNGLALAPNLVLLFSGRFELFQFQWGYFLLYFLAAFLVVAVNWSYLQDAWREVWFYTQRTHRYGASVLTGFAQTLAAANSAPVTRPYPQQAPRLPSLFRGAPRLNPAAGSLNEEQVAALLAADASGALVLAPGQPSALFVDLGRYSHSPALEELRTAAGEPLLLFDSAWPAPGAAREDLVVPLKRGRA